MIEIPRGTWKDPPAPPFWIRVLRTGKPDSATVVCPSGHVGSLLDHEIADDGSVTPSLVCPEDGCGWHEHVRLIGWDHRRWRPYCA